MRRAAWLALVALGACRTAAPPVHLGPPVQGESAPAPREVVREDRLITVSLGGDTSAQLGAVLVRPKNGRGPGIVIVPGASDVSRVGIREGDGTSGYGKKVAVTSAWAEALAARGALVLAYDKRTCGPNDDPQCTKNPQDDLDAEGPVALAKDVDAACAVLKAEPSFDGRLVLFAHGQAAQVALSSLCAKDAKVIVLAAPIPRGVDEVMVAALKERLAQAEKRARGEPDEAKKQAILDEAAQLRNLAGTKEAEFASMKAGRFAPSAKVQGATLAFWKGWIDVTAKTASLAEATAAKKIVVLGGRDLQYAPSDRKRIAALATDGYAEVTDADHHLLTDAALAVATVDQVGALIDAALSPPPAS